MQIAKVLAILMCAGAAFAEIPPGPGKDATVKYCSECHSIEQSVSLRQKPDEWSATLEKMTGMGAKIPQDSVRAIVDYLGKNFGPDAPAQILVNKASRVDLESLLLVKRSESLAIVQYRTEHGPFKSLDDLKKVPGLDFKKVEAKKDLIVF